MKKEIKIGLTVAAGFLLLIWGFNYLKGRDLVKVGDYYYGVYSRIDGLTEANPVFYRGFKIGTVRNIEFNPSSPEKFIVVFSLTQDILLPKDSKAQIYSLDLMGTKGVKFIMGRSSEYLSVGDTLYTSVVGDLKDQVSMEVLPLKDKTERLIVKFDTVLTNIGAIFNEETMRFSNTMLKLNRSMANFQQISQSLSGKLQEDGDISLMIKRTDSLMAMLLAQRPYLDTTFMSLSAFSQQLQDVQIDKAVNDLDTVLNEAEALLSKISEGEGSVGMLLNDDELYNSLTDVSTNLNHLLVDVRYNPKRYVSFSAFDLGKKVVVSDDTYNITGVVYKVLVKESKKPLEIEKEILDGKYEIIESYRDSKYYHTVGQERSFDEIQKIFDEIINKFGESQIVAFENGEKISLRKARKSAD